MPRAECDHHPGEPQALVDAGDERAGSGLDVEHESREALRKLLAHDARGDQRDGSNRSRGIAHGVEAPVRRCNLVRLSDEDTAESLNLRRRGVQRQSRLEAGDGLELVERSTRVAQSAPGDHRDRNAAARNQRREHHGELVTHTAGRVLVHARARQMAQLERPAAPQHAFHQRDGLVLGEAAKEDGHEERGHLIVGEPAGGQVAREGVPLFGCDVTAVTLSLDEVAQRH